MSKLKTTQTTNYQFDNITCEQNPNMTFKEYVFVDNNENWTRADEVIKSVEDGMTTNKADLVNVKSDIVEIKERIKEGTKGDRGQSAYEVAVEEGFLGTAEEWLKSLKGEQGEPGQGGREIELRKNKTHIQHRYVGEVDEAWKNIIALEDIKGDTGAIGANGKNIQLQKTPTHIQWKVAGAESWNNLIPLEDLKGQKGDRGEPADTSQFYTKNEVYNKSEVDEKIAGVSSGGSVDLTNYYNKQQVDQKISEVELTPGPKGDPGQNGKNVELQKTGTHIQWKHEGESQWDNLVELNALKGAQGATGVNGREIELKKSDTHIQWRYVGEGEQLWKNVVALQDIKGVAGENGKQIEIQKSSTHIQWRYVGEGSWKNIVALSDLQISGGGATLTEITFPYANGWRDRYDNSSKIYKIGNIIVVAIHAETSGTGKTSAVLGHLPVGYRPEITCSTSCVDPTGTNHTTLVVNKDGEVKAYSTNGTSNINFSGNVTYITKE